MILNFLQSSLIHTHNTILPFLLAHPANFAINSTADMSPFTNLPFPHRQGILFPMIGPYHLSPRVLKVPLPIFTVKPPAASWNLIKLEPRLQSTINASGDPAHLVPLGLDPQVCKIRLFVIKCRFGPYILQLP